MSYFPVFPALPKFGVFPRTVITGNYRWEFPPPVFTGQPCAMVLGKLPVPGRLTNLILVGQGPTALTVGAGGGCLDIFTLVYHFSFLSPSLWETARYRLKYCLKGPLSPKQPTNQQLMEEFQRLI